MKILHKYHPEFIVNAAALTDVDSCEKDHKSCLSVNANSILNFIPFLKRHDSHLIHISTDFVFDGKKLARTGRFVSLYVVKVCSGQISHT